MAAALRVVCGPVWPCRGRLAYVPKAGRHGPPRRPCFLADRGCGQHHTRRRAATRCRPVGCLRRVATGPTGNAGLQL